ncbi:MAG: hypothetical protein NC541_13955 [bacterium]|nr:hypothetical protein [bacterium]
MRKRKFIFGLLYGILFAAAAVSLWTENAERKAHFTPAYERKELEPFMRREALSEEDYAVLFLQTGLSKSGIDELFAEGRQAELFYLQERFFAPVEYECRQVNVFCRGERLLAPTEEEIAERCRQGIAEYSAAGRSTRGDTDAGTNGLRQTGEEPIPETFRFLPTVRTGDILVTFSGHVFGWRSGHAGIVVDGEAGLVLEAVSVGSVSDICSIDSWKEYPCFVLLRLKDCTEEEAADIAAYAAENLTDVPYDLLRLTDPVAGTPDVLSGTQCAHLVWSAFARFGYDLDGDGGRIVTPNDLYESELLEVIQVYGISPLRND